MESFGGWPIMGSHRGGNWNESAYNLEDLMIRVRNETNTLPLVDIYVAQDDKNPSRYILTVRLKPNACACQPNPTQKQESSLESAIEFSRLNGDLGNPFLFFIENEENDLLKGYGLKTRYVRYKLEPMFLKYDDLLFSIRKSLHCISTLLLHWFSETVPVILKRAVNNQDFYRETDRYILYSSVIPVLFLSI